MAEIQSCFRRVEKKYLLSPEQYEAMRAGMAAHMVPDAHPRYSISNIYYDTPDFELIRTSLEKPVYKEKLRMRSYGVPGDQDKAFVEIKKKFDGVVYKRRVTLPVREAVDWLAGCGEARRGQIDREIEYVLTYYGLAPAAFIAYDREAYAGRDNGELRITFDTRLRGRTNALDLRAGDFGRPILPADQILMEIKIPGAAPMWLARLLSENGIFSSSFSKYGAFYKQELYKQESTRGGQLLLPLGANKYTEVRSIA